MGEQLAAMSRAQAENGAFNAFQAVDDMAIDDDEPVYRSIEPEPESMPLPGLMRQQAFVARTTHSGCSELHWPCPTDGTSRATGVELITCCVALLSCACEREPHYVTRVTCVK